MGLPAAAAAPAPGFFPSFFLMITGLWGVDDLRNRRKLT